MNDMRDFRERYFAVIWALLYPIRLYLKSFPFQRGKGIFLRHFVTPLLPPMSASFDLEVPGQAKVGLRYRETLGLSSLLYGPFEMAELSFVSRYLQQGGGAMDIGANVGLFSVVMGKAVGLAGRVFAFEPVPANCIRLRDNVIKNALENVRVFPLALGAADGTMPLRTATDAAYHSFGKVEGGLGDGKEIAVEIRRLDSVWEEMGRPQIGLVKMDVEGAECDVIKGAGNFLAACRPVLIIEANSIEHLRNLQEQLGVFGYKHQQPKDFVRHNYVFRCDESRAKPESN